MTKDADPSDTKPASSLGHANTVAGTGAPAAHAAMPRYQGSALLGRGGMGEVMKVTDVEIGREIAIKRVRDGNANPQLIDRFLREARIQARLEHPAIVPVYELGHDPDGKPYFTMKRIDGTTLAQLLTTDEPGARRRALRALVDVALAIDFAHRRGIVHRDLKPANVMLGEFGEVHVLDWGVARILVEDAPTSHSIDPSAGFGTSAIDSATRHGDIVGTLGYMAPEQAKGEPIDRSADVYALGTILFEILAGTPLHPRGEPAIASTLAGVTQGPRERAPDREVAPELDALCLAAVATRPEVRPTARELADRLQSYLDGDRDARVRRQLARDHLETARAQWKARKPGSEIEARTLALRESGRALALDPELHEAADLAEELRARPTEASPPEVERAIAEIDRKASRKHARLAAFTLSAHLPFAVVAVLVGVEDWSWFTAYVIASALLVGSAIRDAIIGSTVSAWTSVILCAGVTAIATRMFGPFVIVPSVAAASAISLIVYPPLRKHPLLVSGISLAGWIGPLVLEAAGWLAPTFEISAGTITSSSILAIDGWSGAALVIILNLGVIAATASFLYQIASERRAAQIALALQAWHDRQLSPAK
ncbi:MAG: serine/threonine protein kinase [Deltaproteobacteria bacterium]|nr:serine/threonine protein kinase [Deltaproteobacteria bacterium]